MNLVVAGDADIDEFEWRVGVAEGYDGYVDIAGLGDRLVVHSRIRHHQQTRLFERLLDLIRERSYKQTTSLTCSGKYTTFMPFHNKSVNLMLESRKKEFVK